MGLSFLHQTSSTTTTTHLESHGPCTVHKISAGTWTREQWSPTSSARSWLMYDRKRRLELSPDSFLSYLNHRSRFPAGGALGSASAALREPNRARTANSAALHHSFARRFAYIFRASGALSGTAVPATPSALGCCAIITRPSALMPAAIQTPKSKHGRSTSGAWCQVVPVLSSPRRSSPRHLPWRIPTRRGGRNRLAHRQHAWADSTEHSVTSEAHDIAADLLSSHVVDARSRCPRDGTRVTECARSVRKIDPDPVHGSYGVP